MPIPRRRPSERCWSSVAKVNARLIGSLREQNARAALDFAQPVSTSIGPNTPAHQQLASTLEIEQLVSDDGHQPQHLILSHGEFQQSFPICEYATLPDADWTERCILPNWATASRSRSYVQPCIKPSDHLSQSWLLSRVSAVVKYTCGLAHWSCASKWSAPISQQRR